MQHERAVALVTSQLWASVTLNHRLTASLAITGSHVTTPYNAKHLDRQLFIC
jgi:hypothetical protein